MFQFTAEQVGKVSGVGFIEVLARRYIIERVFLSAAILVIVAVVSLAQQENEYASVPWVDQSGDCPTRLDQSRYDLLEKKHCGVGKAPLQGHSDLDQLAAPGEWYS